MPSTSARSSSCSPSWLLSCQVDLMPEAALNVKIRFLEDAFMAPEKSVPPRVVQPTVEQVVHVENGAA